ncbi:MAG: hypothetical protein AB7Y46_00610 [Armatimonadota bacterium]
MGHDPLFDDFTRRLIQLKLWHVHTLVTEGILPFEQAVRTRTNLFRMTLFAGLPAEGVAEDRQGWAALVDELRVLRERCRDAEQFEREGLAALWPYAEPVIDRDLAELDEFLASAVGCFRFEFAKYYADEHSPDHITLHVRNAYRPDSPFRHLAEMAASLQEILDRAEAVRPDVEWVQCGSWLNSLPPFAGLFPPSWVETAVPGKPGGHMGWWGQFQDRRGGFHERNARLFRESGQFPYRHLLCHCRVAELRAHASRL